MTMTNDPNRIARGGKAVYGADLNLPGMLWAKIVRSPYPHARIKRIDTSKAVALPGVKAVITAQDFPMLEKGATAPLVAFYKGRGLLREVDGTGGTADVLDRVLARLELAA